MKKEDYLAGLAAVADETEVETPEQEQEQPETETTEPTKPRPEAGAVVSEEAKPETPEPFKGWSQLPEDVRVSLQEKLDAAERLKAALDEREREFKRSQERLAPTQRQLSQLQIEAAKKDKQLREYEERFQESLSTESRKKIDQFKEQFPADYEVLEVMTAPALREAASVKNELSEIKKKLEEHDKLKYVSQELGKVAKVHPDFREAYNSQDFKVWRENLDPYERENVVEPRIKSLDHRDAILVLNHFKRDRDWANTIRSQHAPQQEVEEAPARVATPSIDPDPSRRQTAPTRSAGQPMSERKRAFLEAAKFLKQEREKQIRRR